MTRTRCRIYCSTSSTTGYTTRFMNFIRIDKAKSYRKSIFYNVPSSLRLQPIKCKKFVIFKFNDFHKNDGRTCIWMNAESRITTIILVPRVILLIISAFSLSPSRQIYREAIILSTEQKIHVQQRQICIMYTKSFVFFFWKERK